MEKFEDGTTVNAALLIESGLVKKECCGIKVLGSGKLTKKLNVVAAAFSATAKDAIEKAGGTVEVK